MASPGDVYRAAEIGIYQEIVDKFLHPYWGIIAGNTPKGKEPPLPDASEFERMARELVDSRNAEAGPRFTLPAANGGKIISINQIKEQLTTLAGSSGAGLIAGFGAVDDIPDKDKVHRVASAVERGVAKGSSWWTVFMADPLGTLIDLLVGFFTGTLSQRMGERFARSASTAVEQELSEVRKEAGMETLLSSERIIGIGERVAAEGRRVAASSGQSSQPAAIRLRNDIKPLTGSELFRPIVETSIRSYVTDAFSRKDPTSGKAARETLAEGQRSAWTLGLIAHGALKEHDVHALENRVADAVCKVVADCSFRADGKRAFELPDVELKTAVISEIGSELRKLHAERGWSHVDTRINAITEALEKQLTVEQIGKMRQASLLTHGHGLAAMLSPEAKVLASEERRIRRDQGLSGPHEAVAIACSAAKGSPAVAPAAEYKPAATMGGSKGW